jgi:hypothetical protein
MHRSGPVHRVGVELEQAVLVRVSALVSARSRQGTRWRNFEPAYIALELRAGDPTAAADVHRMQFANPHEGVDGRATDSKDLGGLFRRQQEGSAASTSPSDCGSACRQRWRRGLPQISSTARGHAGRPSQQLTGAAKSAAQILQKY